MTEETRREGGDDYMDRARAFILGAKADGSLVRHDSACDCIQCGDVRSLAAEFARVAAEVRERVEAEAEARVVERIMKALREYESDVDDLAAREPGPVATGAQHAVETCIGIVQLAQEHALAFESIAEVESRVREECARECEERARTIAGLKWSDATSIRRAEALDCASTLRKGVQVEERECDREESRASNETDVLAVAPIRAKSQPGGCAGSMGTGLNTQAGAGGAVTSADVMPGTARPIAEEPCDHRREGAAVECIGEHADRETLSGDLNPKMWRTFSCPCGYTAGVPAGEVKS